MGFFRFRRSIKIAPGVRVNLSKSGVSTSIGPRGAKVTLGHGRVRETVGIAGTGLSYTETHRTGASPRSDTSSGVGGGVVALAALVVVIMIAAGGSLIFGIAAAIAIYFLAHLVKGFQSGMADSGAAPAPATEELTARSAVLEANRRWLHERWLRADRARASGAHGEFPSWYFDPVTQPQLERLHRMHVKADGAELTKGAASDLIGIFEPMQDGDAEACRFFNVEIPPEQRNETRGRMETARLFSDPARIAMWEQRQDAKRAPLATKEHGGAIGNIFAFLFLAVVALMIISSNSADNKRQTNLDREAAIQARRVQMDLVRKQADATAFHADRDAIVKEMKAAIAKRDWDAAGRLNDRWMSIVDDKEWNALGAKVKMAQLAIEHAQTAAAEKADRARRRHEGVRVGMTQQQVLESSWGRPESINRTTNLTGKHEQWLYPGFQYLYFDDGILTTVQNH